MMKRAGLGIAILGCLLVVAIAFLVISAVFFGHSSVGGSLAGGRSVSASADCCYMGMETDADTATIRTAGRTIIVAPTTLRIDGLSVASIPATTKSVSISVENGEVEFLVDGRVVGCNTSGH